MLSGLTPVICVQVLVPLLSIGYTGATVTNRTIDDEFGDSVTGRKPVFFPTSTGIWEGETCAGYRVQPDRALAFKGTWNAATFRNEVPGGSGPISIDLAFKGTAIYVYFITGNQIAGGIITTLTECNFTLDGQHVGFFRHTPDQTTNMNYNVLTFQRVNLPNIDHSLRVSTEGVDHHVFVNFDYAIYTFDDEQEPITSSLSHSTSDSSSTTSSSSITMAESSSTISTISSTVRSHSSGVSGSAAPSSTPSVVTESSIVPQSFSPTPTVTPILTGDKKVPLSMILGGTIGCSALVLIIITILLCIYGKRRRQRREFALASAVPLSAQSLEGLPIFVFRDPRTPSMHKGVPSRIHSPPRLSENYDVKVQGYINNPNPSDTSQYMFSSSDPSSRYTETESNNELATAPSSPIVGSEELRTRQIDLERRFLGAQQRLKDVGIEPRLGPGVVRHVGPPPGYSAN